MGPPWPPHGSPCQQYFLLILTLSVWSYLYCPSCQIQLLLHSFFLCLRVEFGRAAWAYLMLRGPYKSVCLALNFLIASIVFSCLCGWERIFSKNMTPIMFMRLSMNKEFTFLPEIAKKISEANSSDFFISKIQIFFLVKWI